MPVKQQLELLRAALEIVEANFEQADANEFIEPPTSNLKNSDDPLLAMAGFFESPIKNVSDSHDKYLGENLNDDHA